MRIVFIGPPGAGKGTQSQRLLDYLHIPHLSTGEMLREAREAKTSTGQLVDSFMVRGNLVPDPIIMQMVGERLERPDSAAGALFDGFPRTLRQAQGLDEALAERGTPLDMVLELQVNDQEVMSRLAGRGRNDDLPEVVAQRLALFWKQTRPLVEYYRKRGLLHAVDGHGTPDEVFARIREAVDQVRSKQRS